MTLSFGCSVQCVKGICAIMVKLQIVLGEWVFKMEKFILMPMKNIPKERGIGVNGKASIKDKSILTPLEAAVSHQKFWVTWESIPLIQHWQFGNPSKVNLIETKI